mmetsp:Transcript_4151/g.13203  ORF Transcript_4151/g.13203 Transcript_4151/m.13203 type:complete len:282 (-) Transcript_4151:177-1022(-)
MIISWNAWPASKSIWISSVALAASSSSSSSSSSLPGIAGGSKKWKNDGAFSSRSTTRTPLPLLWRCFFCLMTTVSLFAGDVHSISVPLRSSSAYSSSSSGSITYVFVSTLFVKKAFSAKWKESLKPFCGSLSMNSVVTLVRARRAGSSRSMIMPSVTSLFLSTVSQKFGMPPSGFDAAASSTADSSSSAGATTWAFFLSPAAGCFGFSSSSSEGISSTFDSSVFSPRATSAADGSCSPLTILRRSSKRGCILARNSFSISAMRARFFFCASLVALTRALRP